VVLVDVAVEVALVVSVVVPVPVLVVVAVVKQQLIGTVKLLHAHPVILVM